MTNSGTTWNAKKKKYNSFKFLSFFIPWIPTCATGKWNLPSKQFTEAVKAEVKRIKKELSENAGQDFYGVDGWQATGKLIVNIFTRPPRNVSEETRQAMMAGRIRPTKFNCLNVGQLVAKSLLECEGVVGDIGHFNPITCNQKYGEKYGVRVNFEAVPQSEYKEDYEAFLSD